MRVIALTLFTLLTYIPASLAQAWPVTSISLTLSTSSAPSDSPDVDFSRYARLADPALTCPTVNILSTLQSQHLRSFAGEEAQESHRH